jgi:DNA-binding NarL/FixJ family response regulator
VPLILAAAVAAVPPLVLLAITHLTSVLARHATSPAGAERVPALQYEVVVTEAPTTASTAEPGTAAELSASGWSNRAIAQHLGVHPSTVGRWLRDRVIGTEPQEELAEGS